MWTFDVHCLLRPGVELKSVACLCVCVCFSVGAVWLCDQSRHRRCDLGPSSTLRHGGKVYIKDTPTGLAHGRHMRVVISVCLCLFLCGMNMCVCVLFSHVLGLRCICAHMSPCVWVCVREKHFVLPQLVCELWQKHSCTTDSCRLGETFSDISALQNADGLWNIYNQLPVS